MIWWTAEQALAWIMWRDKARVAGAGDGRAAALLPRETVQAPNLTETDRNKIVISLLENGFIERQWPDTSEGPYPRRERLIASHSSGCLVAIDVRRKSDGGLPCLLGSGSLIWLPPQQEPMIRFKDALKQMEEALKNGKIAAKALIASNTKDVPIDSWIHKTFNLSVDGNVGGYMTIDGRQAHRLRFDGEAIVQSWPDGKPIPEKRHKPLRGAALGSKLRAELIDKAISHFNEEGYDTLEDIVIWLSKQSEHKKDGGIDRRTARKWAEHVENRLAQRSG